EAAELRALAAGLSPSVEASTLSWLQSSLLTSMSFSTSSSLAVCAASSATAGSDWSSDGADWASAGNANAVKKPAANSSALTPFLAPFAALLLAPFNVEVIAPARAKHRRDGVPVPPRM